MMMSGFGSAAGHRGASEGSWEEQRESLACLRSCFGALSKLESQPRPIQAPLPRGQKAKAGSRKALLVALRRRRSKRSMRSRHRFMY